jgi:TonB family protein
VHFKIDPAGTSAQEPSSEVVEKRRRLELEAVEAKQRLERQIQELKQAMEQAPNADARARLEADLKHLMEEKKGYANTSDGKLYLLRSDEEGQRRERQMKERHDTELAKLARISMDQAIQIATSKIPGKVLEASLVGERWSGEGELAKPSLVLYHLVILSGDDANPVTSHVLVNASDGSIVKAEREERKRENPELINSNRSAEKALYGGVLNRKATSLPIPEYPTIARQDHVSGSVNVEVLIDEIGNVVEAHSVSGHPLLQAAAVSAARQATFAPTRLNGEPVMIRGVITYSFLAQ